MRAAVDRPQQPAFNCGVSRLDGGPAICGHSPPIIVSDTMTTTSTQIDPRTLRTLEFDKIITAVKRYASFTAGHDRIEGLRPSTDPHEVIELLEQVAEARSLLNSSASVTIGGSRDVRSAAGRAGIGSILRTDELLDIAATLDASRDLKAQITKSPLEIPRIRRWGGDLGTFPEIVNRIYESIDSGSGEILDSASPRLRQIRSDIKTAHGRLMERLNSMITSTEYRTALQEPIVTMRNGRFVVPVRQDSKSKVPGIVHDQSSSGQTSFVEPLVVTELNNRWAELQLEEHREIERILEEISRRVGGQADGIRATVEALADLDCAFARAKYANATKSTPPSTNEAGIIRLINARHPLLSGDVVPVSLTLGERFDVLVITGPNTGGKTVALKTVGLLTLMAQAGMHVPADDGTELSVFSSVWADIGDEQSIEQSLSTFSSHMTNIIKILAHTDEHSLVLLDELGAGTDPQEGSGLARAIIRELQDLKARALTTTHYSELKAFAHEQPRIENASVEFDVETLSPTYRLMVGVPGRSQALAIAKRLGLPTAIVERARSYVSQGGLRVERLLSQIQQERQGIAAVYKRAQELNEDITKLRDRLQDEVKRTRDDRSRVLQEARAEGDEAVNKLRSKLAELEAEANRSGSAKPSAQIRQVRQEIHALRNEIVGELATAPQPEPEAPADSTVVGPISIGDEVQVESLGGLTGTVIAHSGHQYELQVGHFKVTRPEADIKKVQAAGKPSLSLQVRAPSRDMTSELDVRGRRPQEIEPEIERYINDSYMSGLETLRIIHGHGTGALRKAIREQLDAHPLVAGVAAAGKAAGGEGVTVATLAK
jgi:DNA mismatch repair protein MutS2